MAGRKSLLSGVSFVRSIKFIKMDQEFTVKKRKANVGRPPLVQKQPAENEEQPF